MEDKQDSPADCGNKLKGRFVRPSDTGGEIGEEASTKSGKQLAYMCHGVLLNSKLYSNCIRILRWFIQCGRLDLSMWKY